MQDVRKRCYSESITLLQKMQGAVTFLCFDMQCLVRNAYYPLCIYTGIPAATERLKLELTVSYNAFLFSLGFSNPSEIEENLTRTLLRGNTQHVLYSVWLYVMGHDLALCIL